ncbi:DL-methionine transporter ATP-binding subunit [compost metagenome]
MRQIADTVSVLHNGRQVDYGTVDEVFSSTSTAYTRELIEAIPGQKFPRAEISRQPIKTGLLS